MLLWCLFQATKHPWLWAGACPALCHVKPPGALILVYTVFSFLPFESALLSQESEPEVCMGAAGVVERSHPWSEGFSLPSFLPSISPSPFSPRWAGSSSDVPMLVQPLQSQQSSGRAALGWGCCGVLRNLSSSSSSASSYSSFCSLSKPCFVLLCQDEKEQLIQSKSSVASLVGRSKSIVQLRPRNPEHLVKSTIPIKAVCDYRQIEVRAGRGRRCGLEPGFEWEGTAWQGRSACEVLELVLWCLSMKIRDAVGREEEGRSRLFFLEETCTSQIYSGKELKSFSPGRMGFISLSQTSTCVAASSASWPLPLQT